MRTSELAFGPLPSSDRLRGYRATAKYASEHDGLTEKSQYEREIGGLF